MSAPLRPAPGPPEPPRDRWANLVTLGMLCATVVACVYLVTR